MPARWILPLVLFLALVGGGCGKGKKQPAEDLSLREHPTRTEAASPEPAAAPGDTFKPNLSVTIRESAINDLLKAIGPLNRSGHVGPKTGITAYSLDIPPPLVEIRRDSAFLHAQVTVKALGTQYTTEAIGQASVEYDPQHDELYLALGKTTTDIHMKALGVAINLDNVDISSFYSPRIKLLGKLPLATDFTVKKPETGKEAVRFTVARHRITYRPGFAVLDMVVEFKRDPLAQATRSAAQ
jgi:hypothetical protein